VKVPVALAVKIAAVIAVGLVGFSALSALPRSNPLLAWMP
jgi:hypothetical protein